MKSLLLLLLPFFITATTLAQGTEATPSERFPSLPPFTIQGLDSSNFTKADLSKNKKTLIMYFSPGCDHCQHETEALLKDIELFKDVQIVMASYQPIEEIAGFHKKYNLANYPQIKIGRDTNFFFVPFYKIRDLPFLALYNAKGELLQTYAGTTDIQKVADGFQKKSKKKR